HLGDTNGKSVKALVDHMVLSAVTGATRIGTTQAALARGTGVDRANKEAPMIGWPRVLEPARAARPSRAPVGRAHIERQHAVQARSHREVSKLIITASGGPFRGMTREALRRVTAGQALNHPTWSMGAMITLNSATLVNKGLEVIEAHLLFEIDFDHIEVVVHPQSHIHSMVEFTDASTIAQISPPDMRLPISYALGTQADGSTTRLGSAAVPNNWGQPMHWSFEPVDHPAFP